MKPGCLYISFVLIAVSLLSSCVSNKKYNELVSAKAESDKKYFNLDTAYSSLKAEMENAALLNSAHLSRQGKELTDKEKELEEKRLKIEELNNIMNAQRALVEDLKKEVCNALQCFTPDELSIEVRNGKLYVSLADKLLFPSGSDQVNERGKEAITALTNVLSTSGLEVIVEGHTDSIPILTAKYKDNWDLSVYRATSVTRLFIENGIAPSRIIASGRGEYYPLTNNSSDKNRQQNRRTEIILAPKLDKLWKLTSGDDTMSKK